MTTALDEALPAPADRLITLPHGAPALTLGWGAAKWAMTYLRQPNGPRAGQPFRPTPQQLDFLLWWYALDEHGFWLYQHAVRRLSKGAGKAERLSAPVPTPSGWTTVGELRPGDELFGADGSVIRCVQTHPVLTDTPGYRVTLNDGTSSVFSGEHLFAVDEFVGGRKRVRKTLSVTEMADAGLRWRCGEFDVARYVIPGPPVLQLPERKFPVPPWVLGLWLGDGERGSARVTVGDDDLEHVLMRLRECGVDHGKLCHTGAAYRTTVGPGWLLPALRELGVLTEKRIPRAYLRGSAEQRLALLQGLMDSDGWIGTNGAAEFCVCSEGLANDTAELIRSLGMKVRVRASEAVMFGRVVGTRYRLSFKPYADLPVVTLPRKVTRLRARTYSSAPRTVRAIEPVAPEPMRCITVSATDGLYLTGESFWVTHNSPWAAVLALLELCGPVRFDRWDPDAPGGCVGRRVAMPLVQIAAVSEAQTENTQRMVRAFAPKRSRVVAEHGLEPGKTQYNVDPEGSLKVLTSSSHTAEGAEASFVIADETEWWLPGNGGPAFYATLLDNLTKSGSRMVETANAWVPGIGSVAEASWDAWVAQEEGTFSRGARILYDARVAPPNTDMADDASLTAALEFVYEGCWWQRVEPIKARIWSPAASPDESRRKYLNQPTASVYAWVTPQEWSACADPTHVVGDGAEVVLFFDGSKSRDATALVGCELDTGHVFTLDVWEPDPAHDSTDTVDTGAVDAAVQIAFDRYSVVAFFADVKEWESFALTEWPNRHGDDLLVWAAPGSRPPQPIAWDMRSHSVEFARAAEACHEEIVTGAFTHDGDSRTARHVGNAHRRPVRDLVSISKESPDSRRKIDAAVCVIGARMVRRLVLGSKDYQRRKRRVTGRGRVIVLDD